MCDVKRCLFLSASERHFATTRNISMLCFGCFCLSAPILLLANALSITFDISLSISIFVFCFCFVPERFMKLVNTWMGYLATVDSSESLLISMQIERCNECNLCDTIECLTRTWQCSWRTRNSIAHTHISFHFIPEFLHVENDCKSSSHSRVAQRELLHPSFRPVITIKRYYRL